MANRNIPRVLPLASRSQTPRTQAKPRLNVCSVRSTFSCCAFLSFCGVVSAMSVCSVVSMGSVLSVLSIGSTLSVMSLGSVYSFLSIGSYGCTMRAFQNCMTRKSAEGLSMEIRVGSEDWDHMATCTRTSYQMFKQYETEDDPCDYHRASCVFVNRISNTSSESPCDIRRKGFSAFKDMDKGPSLKVKFYDDARGKYDFPMGRINGVALQADKVTLNNMEYSRAWNGHDEVDVYDLLRHMGYFGLPLAQRIEVSAYRDDERVWSSTHALVEDVNNDDYFMRMGYDEYILLEADNTRTELKEAKGTFEDTLPTEQMELLLNTEEKQGKKDGLLAQMDVVELLKIHVAERITHNWDGATMRMRPRNFYWLTGADSLTRIVPKGMDWTYQGCVYAFFASSEDVFLGPVQRAVAENPATLDAIYRTYSTDALDSMSCAQEVGITVLITAANTLSALCALACGTLYLHRRSVSL